MRGPSLLRDAMRREVGVLHRQLECLRLAGEGLTRPEIAARLGLPETTVASLLHAVRHRLGAVSTGHAIVLAWRAGAFPDLQEWPDADGGR